MERVRLKKAGTFDVDNQPDRRGGRKPGQRNRITTLLKDAIIMAAELTGSDKKGKDGLVGYLQWMAKVEPKSFASLLGRVIPLHVVGSVDHNHRQMKSKEDVLEELRARGIPVDRIYPRLIEHTPHEYIHDDHETEQ